MNRPWYVASYICGLSHMNKVHRTSLERRWKTYIQYLCFRGRYDSFYWINAEKYVVETYNDGNSNNQIRFIICVTLEMVNET